MRLTRLAAGGLAIVAFLVLPGAAAPTRLGPGPIVSFIVSSEGGEQAGGGLLGGFGPILLVGLAVAIVALVGAAFVLFRTRGAARIPPPSEGWWTCGNCGAGNVDGAARCHACATWRSTTPSATPSASP